MSRHRNMHNLDYDDYYDDDYYDDYDDDDYYAEDAAKRTTQQESTQVKQSSTSKNKQSTTKQQKQQTPANTAKKAAGTASSQYNNSSRKVVGSTPVVVSIGRGTASISSVTNNTNRALNIKEQQPLKVGQDAGAEIGERNDVTLCESNPAAKGVEVDDGLLEKLMQKEYNYNRSKISMVVLGHVDAGKSTLMGQVLLQLGSIDKRIISKYQKQASQMNKESFALAWVMDEEESERERGVTMEVGTRYVTLKQHDVMILDAPGHADFIPSMISGAASADVGLLVIAATTGEFEAGFSPPDFSNQQVQHGGQTREHIILSRGLGVSQLIVAINKLDVTTPQWNQARFIQIQQKVHPFLLASGFVSKRIRYVPVSGLTGVNVKARGEMVKGLEWYNGPTLLEAMDTYIPAQRNFEKPLRILISDVYQEGRNVTTRGRIIQGLLRTNDKIVVLPIGDEATVYRIDHQNVSSITTLDKTKYAVAGDTVHIILSGIDAMRISTGCVLCHPASRANNTIVPLHKKFLAQIVVMENLTTPIIRGAQVLLHMHSIDVPATISKLVSVIKKQTTKNSKLIIPNTKPPRVITSGVSATVEIRTSDNLCLEEFRQCRPLGRFVLRRGGDTIAVGVIEKLLR